MPVALNEKSQLFLLPETSAWSLRRVKFSKFNMAAAGTRKIKRISRVAGSTAVYEYDHSLCGTNRWPLVLGTLFEKRFSLCSGAGCRWLCGTGPSPPRARGLWSFHRLVARSSINLYPRLIGRPASGTSGRLATGIVNQPGSRQVSTTAAVAAAV